MIIFIESIIFADVLGNKKMYYSKFLKDKSSKNWEQYRLRRMSWATFTKNLLKTSATFTFLVTILSLSCKIILD
jgi:hypothetical protein